MAAGDTTPGYRAQDYEDYFDHGPGAYWGPCQVDLGDAGSRIMWHVTPPCGHAAGRLATFPQDPKHHTITEHDDVTITVGPSIWCQLGGDDHHQPCWHGYLEQGVWLEV